MVIRCFFMREGHFAGVEILPDGPPAEAVRQAEGFFKQRAEAERFDGFEVWDGDHLIYRTGKPASGRPSRPSTDLVALSLVIGAWPNVL